MNVYFRFQQALTGKSKCSTCGINIKKDNDFFSLGRYGGYKMEIQVGKRKCFCRYSECNKNNGLIFPTEKRVAINEFHYGYAHPNCALKILNNRINDYVGIRNKILEKHKDEIAEMVADEL